MQSFWCERAWLGGDTVATGVLVGVEGDRIASITTAAAAPPGATVLRGVVVPGFANGHSHAFHRVLRGRTHRGADSFWSWRDQMYRAAAVLQPDSYHRLARAVFAEMVCSGVSCVGEFHYLHHDTAGARYADPNAMSAALVTAASEAGLRITLLDTCYLSGGLTSDGRRVPLEGVQLRFGDGDVDAWCERVEAARHLRGPGVALGAAVHSVRAVDPESIAAVVSRAADADMVVHAHVAEQPAEVEQCRAAHGATPVEIFARAGALGASFTAVHATHLTDLDVSLLGGTQTNCCICATTERDLADGIGPTSRLRDAGASLCVGTDSHAVIDLFEETRAVELDERLATRRRGSHTVTDLLEMATWRGHAALGWSTAGRLEVGAMADLVAVRLDSARTAGGGADPLGAVVFAAAPGDVTDVVIGGRQVVSDGRHRLVDVERELVASIAEVDR